MKTLLTKKQMAAVLAASIGLAFSGQASAYVYADSRLTLSNLDINFGNPTASTINNYTFTLTNTATLNGVPIIQTNACGQDGVSNTCNPAGPVLTSPAANAPGSTVVLADTTLTPTAAGGTAQFANATSIINTAQIVQGGTSSTDQLAQSQVQAGASASSSAGIISSTTLTEAFTLITQSTFNISFTALLQMLVAADVVPATDTASVQISFVLTDGANNTLMTWDGTTCTAATLGGCTVTNSNTDVNLNSTISLVAAGSNTGGGSSNFNLSIANLLDSGKYNLSLNTQTSTNTVQRRSTVAEPSTMLLLGAGLLGAGLTRRKTIAKLAA